MVHVLAMACMFAVHDSLLRGDAMTLVYMLLRLSLEVKLLSRLFAFVMGCMSVITVVYLHAIVLVLMCMSLSKIRL